MLSHALPIPPLFRCSGANVVNGSGRNSAPAEERMPLCNRSEPRKAMVANCPSVLSQGLYRYIFTDTPS